MRAASSGGSPINLVVRADFNPNLKTAWFSAMTQVINQITLLTVILTGAALIREREQGTVEHLLVMPVVPAEIMLAKMFANGLVILVAAMLSLQFVVHWWIGAPIAGSIFLFLLGAALYALVVAALGILLGTLSTTMGQFGLLAMPVLIVTQLLSGSSTPMESMPVWLQYVMRTISPTPHFVSFAQAVLFRGADITLVWRPAGRHAHHRFGLLLLRDEPLPSRHFRELTAMAKDNGTDDGKMKRKLYEKELRKLQVELCHVQEWVKAKGRGSSSCLRAATPPARAGRSRP